MPFYDYSCSHCGNTFERRVPSEEYLTPTQDPCPECNSSGTVEYRPSFSIGDPIKLGITRPPDAFLHGVLGRMQKSMPIGTEKGRDGISRVKYADFSKARYQPGRLV